MFRVFVILLMFFSVFIYGCVFKGEFVNSTGNSSVVNNQFDIYPPVFELISPKEDSVISNLITFFGSSYDESTFFVFVEFGNTNIVFTNTDYWFFKVNTFDFTNGLFEVKLSARDILGNSSTHKNYKFYISNDLQLFMDPSYIVFTNVSFNLQVYLSSTNYSYLKIFSNGVFWFTTNGVKNFYIPIITNSFIEGSNNLVFVLDDVITNIFYFVFDFSLPNFQVYIKTNQYVFGNYPLSVFVDDTNAVYCHILYGSISNTFYLTNGTNIVYINTFLLDNGTNHVYLRFSDIAGNSTDWIDFPVIVANFYSIQILRESSKSKYYLNSEVVSNNVRLYFTDNNFSSIFIAREENNFSKEVVKQTSLDIEDKLLSLITESNIYIAYIKYDSILVVRTNYNLTNFYQMFSDSEVSDYSLFCNGNVYILRTKTNGLFLITDISNKITNFVTNMPNVYKVFSEKYSLSPSILYGCYFTDDNFVIFTNGFSVFTTNISLIDASFVSLSNSFYVSLASISNVSFLWFSNTILTTNFVINFTNNILSVRGIRKENSVVFGIVSIDGDQNVYLNLIEIKDGYILRNQLINTFAFKGLDNSRYFDLVWNKNNLMLLIPFVDYTYHGFYVFTGL
ncbi:MAG: hypothetical protein ACP5QP_05585 [Brevinematia bacterium]